MACKRGFNDAALWEDALKRLMKDNLAMVMNPPHYDRLLFDKQTLTHSYLTVRREVRSHPLRAARGSLVWHRYVQGWSELERQQSAVSLGLTLKHLRVLDEEEHRSELPRGWKRTLAPAKEEGKPFRFDQP